MGFENLKNIYGNRGYINFLPTPEFDFDYRGKFVNLTINIDEDQQYIINRIAFTGNTTTRGEVILREIIPFREGDVFNASLLEVLRLRLNQLGLFEEIEYGAFRVQPVAGEPKVNIDVRVQENSRKGGRLLSLPI